MGFVADLVKTGAQFASSAAPTLGTLASVAAPVTSYLGYREQREGQKAAERAAQEQRADAARIRAEAEQNQVAQNAAMQAQQQEARKAFSQRLTNRSEVLKQELARQNLLQSPAGQGRLSELEAEGVRGMDRLSADLASQGEQARQRALYSLPGLSERQFETQQRLNASNPAVPAYREATELLQEFGGRAGQDGGFFGYRLGTTPGINPNAPTPRPRAFRNTEAPQVSYRGLTGLR